MANGLDLSFARTTAGWWLLRKNEGVEAMSQCLHTGGDVQALIPTASQNLLNAHSVGMKLSGYLNASPWKPGDVVLAEAKGVAGAAWDLIPVLFVDIEIDGLTEERIRATIEAAEATGKAVAVYSAKWFWEGHLGNAQWPWIAKYQLWAADYDEDPALETATLFGPWAQAHHKQFTNSHDVDGVTVDSDTFSLELWEDEDMALADDVKQLRTDVNTLVTQKDALDERVKSLETDRIVLSQQIGGLAQQIKAGGPAVDALIAEIRKRLED